ncbi:YadA domain protein, partial [Actinobacillus minor 202]
KGWNITTSGNITTPATEAKVEMGNTVTIDGGNNILLTQTDKKISIATSMTPTFTNVTTGNTVMNNDGLTIKGGPNVTTSGIDAGNKVITNVSNGSISVDSKDAVNGSQLYTVQESVKAAKTEVKAGTNTRVESASATDGHTIYTVHANNTKVTEGSGISVTSTTNEQNETSYTVALNEETKNQLKKEESASAGNSNVNVTLNTSKNSTGGNDYIVTLNNTLDLTKDGSVTIGGTTVNNDGLKITNGPNITSSGIDAGDKKITNVTEGNVSADSKEAVNGSQLYATNQNVT